MSEQQAAYLPHLSEHAEQVVIFQWAAFQETATPELKMLHAIPNGGHRNKVVAGKLKAEGVRRGVPDMCLPVPRSGYHGLYIELKVGKNKPTLDQSFWLDALNHHGYQAMVCYGEAEAIEAITDYLKG